MMLEEQAQGVSTPPKAMRSVDDTDHPNKQQQGKRDDHDQWKAQQQQQQQQM